MPQVFPFQPLFTSDICSICVITTDKKFEKTLEDLFTKNSVIEVHRGSCWGIYGKTR